MKIFVDFDNTIFDTRHKFLDAFFGVFENYGVSREIFEETLPHFSKTTLQSGKCYSPERHIKIIKKNTGRDINEKVFLQEISEFLEKLEKFVFEDFYAFVNQYNKEDLIILSYGEQKFQQQKIVGSGVEQFFIDTIITQDDKAVDIEKYMQDFLDESAILIDDKAEYFENMKKLSIDTKTIHIIRDDKKCENDNWCDMCVGNLRDVSGII